MHKVDERRSSLTDLISENPGFWLINGSSPYFILHSHESLKQEEKRRRDGGGGEEEKEGGVTEREGVL